MQSSSYLLVFQSLSNTSELGFRRTWFRFAEQVPIPAQDAYNITGSETTQLIITLIRRKKLLCLFAFLLILANRLEMEGMVSFIVKHWVEQTGGQL